MQWHTSPNKDNGTWSGTQLGESDKVMVLEQSITESAIQKMTKALRRAVSISRNKTKEFEF